MSCWRCSGSPTRPTARPRPTPAGCADGSTSPAALVAAPPVLFLDEPTTGLDVRSRTGLWEVIRDLVGQGATLLLTTQYLEEADQLCDDVVVIDHGHSIADGTPDELKSGIGGERIEVTVCELSDLAAAQSLLADVAKGEVDVEEHRGALIAPIEGGASTLTKALQRARARRHRAARRRAPAPDARRGVPDPHGPHRRGSVRGRRRARSARGGGVMQRLAFAFADTTVIAKRNIIKIKRVPEILVFVLISPIMFVLLFAFVFGNAIDVPGGDYREFLIAGVFTQTVMFGSTFTAAGLAEDMQKGIISRFRSLPMSRAAVLTGRTTSDILYNVLSLIIMSLTGLLVGWSINTLVRRGHRRVRAAAALRLRDLVGHGVDRALGSERRGRQQRGLHGAVPADVPREHVRSRRGPARRRSRPSPSGARSRPSRRRPRELFGNIPEGTPEPRRGRSRTRSSTR